MAKASIRCARCFAASPYVPSLETPYAFPMCGRYRLARKKEILAETFDVENDVDWSPRYNVAPGQNIFAGALHPAATLSGSFQFLVSAPSNLSARTRL